MPALPQTRQPGGAGIAGLLGRPSSGAVGELPAGGKEAIFSHYGLSYQGGSDGERQLARR